MTGGVGRATALTVSWQRGRFCNANSRFAGHGVKEIHPTIRSHKDAGITRRVLGAFQKDMLLEAHCEARVLAGNAPGSNNVIENPNPVVPGKSQNDLYQGGNLPPHSLAIVKVVLK